jgi:uncharacterized protein (DUF983 family)
MLTLAPQPDLPHTLSRAALRGIKGKCPRCGQARLFGKYLKPVAQCPSCSQDWTLHQADDFPPYISIILTGHLIAPVLIAIGGSAALTMGVKITLAMVLAAALMLALLQPAKGAVIALQWWMGMHGFSPAGRDEAAAPLQGTAENPLG